MMCFATLISAPTVLHHEIKRVLDHWQARAPGLEAAKYVFRIPSWVCCRTLPSRGGATGLPGEVASYCTLPCFLCCVTGALGAVGTHEHELITGLDDTYHAGLDFCPGSFFFLSCVQQETGGGEKERGCVRVRLHAIVEVCAQPCRPMSRKHLLFRSLSKSNLQPHLSATQKWRKMRWSCCNTSSL